MLEYRLALDVDFPSSGFRGTVAISGIEEPGPATLDSLDLSIHAVRAEGDPVPYVLDEEGHHLQVNREAGSSAVIEIDFSGRAVEGLQTGLFVGRLGEQKALSTQMEPESCRRLLPCFDRPDRKAVFRLTVTTQPELVVISNMPGAVEPLSDGRSRWVFAPTPPMSSYLLYLGVGPFEETVDDDGPIRVIVAGPPGRHEVARRTARIARTVLRGFTDYFDLPYPLPKLHFVALSDFWAGMENWGAILGADEMYLLDDSASPALREFGDQVIVHEIAHQWFGDLVTLRTWDDLWLNEAFATFAVPLVQEQTHLRRDPWTEFAMRTLGGDRVDSLWSAHPVKPQTYVAAEIMANADLITYRKGARLIRMIEGFVGHDAFRDGITEYLRDHEYRNTTSDDLWSALEEESGQPIARVMRAWVERPGHPVVSVRQVGPDVELTQRRFTYVPGAGHDPPWPIPLVWEEGDRRETRVFDTEHLLLPGRDAARMRFDPERAGFFHLLWSPELRPTARAQLANGSSSDRLGWVTDAYAFLLSGDYSVREYAETLHVAGEMHDRATVEGVARSLDELHAILWDDRPFEEAARRYCRLQSEHLTERSAPKEAESLDVARDWLFWVRSRIDGEFAHSLAHRHASIDREPATIRQAIASAYCRERGAEAVKLLLDQLCGPDPDAATRASYALGSTSDPKSLLRGMDERLASIPMAPLYAYLIPSISKNPVCRDALWGWLTEHLQGLAQRGTGTPMMMYLFERSLPFLGIGRSIEVRERLLAEPLAESRPGVLRGLELLEASERLRRAAGLG